MTDEERASALRLYETFASKGITFANVGVGKTDTPDGRITCLFVYCTKMEATRIGELESFEGYPVKFSIGGRAKALHGG